MTDLLQDQPPPGEPLPPVPYTPLERYNISPVLFALLALLAVFILYQIVGGVLTLLAFGMKPTAQQIGGFRLATGLGQVLFILLPTLLLVRLATFSPAAYLRLRPPDGRLLALPIIGIFSLQQLLQIYLTVQDKIPLPHSFNKFIEPLKQAIEETYHLLVASNSVPELLIVILVVALIPAVCEEFLFRGLVQRSFERVLGSWKGVIWTGIIFGAYHLNPFSFLPLALLGIYLGFLTMRSGSIWTSVTAHFFNNAMAAGALYLNLNEDAVVTGNPKTMSGLEMLSSFILFGSIFVVSTYAFIVFTRTPPPEAPVPPESTLPSDTAL